MSDKRKIRVEVLVTNNANRRNKVRRNDYEATEMGSAQGHGRSDHTEQREGH
jgi:hypothetical protein